MLTAKLATFSCLAMLHRVMTTCESPMLHVSHLTPHASHHLSPPNPYIHIWQSWQSWQSSLLAACSTKRVCDCPIIGIEADDLRLLNDEGQPYLYPHNLFVVVDGEEPADWQTEYGEEGERYAYSPELGRPGFFEDYFDGNPAAIHAFHHYLAK
jgi:hypothetical protein